MPGNLIAQQNQIRGYTDEALSQEMSTPSGVVPPFLVLNELNRRKTVRDAYEGQAGKGSRTTVVEDLAQPADPATLFADPAAAPMAPAGVPGYAEGGIVSALRRMEQPANSPTFDRLMSRYEGLLDAIPKQRDDARSFALIQAGLGMMAAESPNFFTNIGTGAAPALEGYRESLASIDSGEMDILRGQLGLEQYMSDQDLARMDRDFRERQEANRVAEAMNKDERTAAQRNFEQWSTMEPGPARDAFARSADMDESSNYGRDPYLKDVQKRFADEYATVEKAIKSDVGNELVMRIQGAETEEERVAAEAELEAVIWREATERFHRLYPGDEGLIPQYSPGTSPPGGVATPTGSLNDPLDLGL